MDAFDLFRIGLHILGFAAPDHERADDKTRPGSIVVEPAQDAGLAEAQTDLFLEFAQGCPHGGFAAIDTAAGKGSLTGMAGKACGARGQQVRCIAATGGIEADIADRRGPIVLDQREGHGRVPPGAGLDPLRAKSFQPRTHQVGQLAVEATGKIRIQGHNRHSHPLFAEKKGPSGQI